MALARALAVEPKVLLLDEPFGALDAKVREELRAWLRRLHDEVHVTTIFVTHDQEEAMDVAEQIVVMNDGKVEQAGAPRDLYEHPRDGVRDELHRPGQPARHDVHPPARRRDPHAPGDGADEAMIERIVHLGFEVRVEFTLADGDGAVGADHPRAGRGARDRGGPDRLRAAVHGAGLRGQAERAPPDDRRAAGS